ncbi:MAG: hypothetical protein ACR2MC_00070 [Actinomycetota bacterium]
MNLSAVRLVGVMVAVSASAGGMRARRLLHTGALEQWTRPTPDLLLAGAILLRGRPPAP